LKNLLVHFFKRGALALLAALKALALPEEWCHISMRETNASPRPRNIRMNTSVIAASGHAARYAKGASDSGEYCDEDFEQLAPVEMSF
jgi:hypothetical protein